MSITVDDLFSILNDEASLLLQARRHTFNPYRVLGLEDYEIRHTNTLAWLLDPQESHGLGDIFLRLFLHSACKAASDFDVLKKYDLSDKARVSVHRETYIRKGELVFPGLASAAAQEEGEEEEFPETAETEIQERSFIDIWIEGDDWVVVVEAKIGSKEGNNQLPRYRSAIEKWKAKQKKGAPPAFLLLYLTLNGESARDEAERPFWKPIKWHDNVAQVITRTLNAHPSVAPYQKSFISSYVHLLHEVCPPAEGGPVDTLVNHHRPVLTRLKDAIDRKEPGDWRKVYERNVDVLSVLTQRVRSSRQIMRDLLLKTIEEYVDSQGRSVFTVIAASDALIEFVPTEWIGHPFFAPFEVDTGTGFLFNYSIYLRNKDRSCELKLYFTGKKGLKFQTYRQARIALLEKLLSDGKRISRPDYQKIFDVLFKQYGWPGAPALPNGEGDQKILTRSINLDASEADVQKSLDDLIGYPRKAVASHDQARRDIQASACEAEDTGFDIRNSVNMINTLANTKRNPS